MRLIARAPSNIALIKYMGKRAGGGNLPENPSLSMTLDTLCTVVQVELAPSSAPDSWSPGRPSPALPYQGADLGARGSERALKHVARVRAAAPEILARCGLEARAEPFAIAFRSANTFPAASGVASSASAFAAITLAAAAACAADARAFARALDDGPALRRALASLSREGSGSSCRSFEGPWVEWSEQGVQAVAANLPRLRHFVILVSSEAKAVSSSDAHARVKTSPQWAGRPDRATARVDELKRALTLGDLATVSRLAWDDFQDMHALFHASEPPFTYWHERSRELLAGLEPRVGSPYGPIVTMDAGANVHVTVAENQAAEWRRELAARFPGTVLEDAPGLGATLQFG